MWLELLPIEAPFAAPAVTLAVTYTDASPVICVSVATVVGLPILLIVGGFCADDTGSTVVPT